jgi:hypothetical protein
MRDFDGRPVVTWWIARFAALRWPRARVRRLGVQGGGGSFEPKRGQVEVSSKTFRDRIVELRRVPARELIPNPRNWRRHPVRGELLILAKSVIRHTLRYLRREFCNVTVDDRTGELPPGGCVMGVIAGTLSMDGPPASLPASNCSRA